MTNTLGYCESIAFFFNAIQKVLTYLLIPNKRKKSVASFSPPVDENMLLELELGKLNSYKNIFFESKELNKSLFWKLPSNFNIVVVSINLRTNEYVGNFEEDRL